MPTIAKVAQNKQKVGRFTVVGNEERAEIRRGRKVEHTVEFDAEQRKRFGLSFQHAVQIARHMEDYAVAKKHAPTQEQARNMLGRLQAYGRTCYCKTAKITRGESLGMAVSHFSLSHDVVDAAMTMLQDQNAHLSCAAVAAIEQGEGKVSRKGRELTIMLPEHWETA